MAEESIKVTGLKEAQKALYGYSQKLGDFVVYKALRAGADVVKKTASANAPVYRGKPLKNVKSGTLKRGFKISKSKIHNGKLSSSMIGVYLTLKKGKGRKDPNDPFYGRWQETGWNTRGKLSNSRAGIKKVFGSRSGRKSSKGSKNVPGKLFMLNAFESKKEQAANVIVASAKAGAETLAKKEGL